LFALRWRLRAQQVFYKEIMAKEKVVTDEVKTPVSDAPDAPLFQRMGFESEAAMAEKLQALLDAPKDEASLPTLDQSVIITELKNFILSLQPGEKTPLDDEPAVLITNTTQRPIHIACGLDPRGKVIPSLVIPPLDVVSVPESLLKRNGVKELIGRGYLKALDQPRANNQKALHDDVLTSAPDGD
jgi:hypothetical protein